jgi:hypothetical protein
MLTRAERDAAKVNTHQRNQKGMPPRLTHSKIAKQERLWLRPTRFDMRKNQRAMTMANPVLHYEKSQGQRSRLNAPNKHKQ